MVKELNLRIDSEHINNEDFINACILEQLQIRIDDVKHIEILKRSIDARKSKIKYNLKVAVYIGEEFNPISSYFNPQDVKKSKEVVIIGAGPAGMFAGLHAIENGLKPIISSRMTCSKNQVICFFPNVIINLYR